ncbi:hypothetical protein BDW66DRAFT_109092 [Aspergillus desertorum]
MTLHLAAPLSDVFSATQPVSPTAPYTSRERCYSTGSRQVVTQERQKDAILRDTLPKASAWLAPLHCRKATLAGWRAWRLPRHLTRRGTGVLQWILTVTSTNIRWRSRMPECRLRRVLRGCGLHQNHVWAAGWPARLMRWIWCSSRRRRYRQSWGTGNHVDCCILREVLDRALLYRKCKSPCTPRWGPLNREREFHRQRDSRVLQGQGGSHPSRPE